MGPALRGREVWEGVGGMALGSLQLPFGSALSDSLPTSVVSFAVGAQLGVRCSVGRVALAKTLGRCLGLRALGQGFLESFQVWNISHKASAFLSTKRARSVCMEPQLPLCRCSTGAGRLQSSWLWSVVISDFNLKSRGERNNSFITFVVVVFVAFS